MLNEEHVIRVGDLVKLLRTDTTTIFQPQFSALIQATFDTSSNLRLEHFSDILLAVSAYLLGDVSAPEVGSNC